MFADVIAIMAYCEENLHFDLNIFSEKLHDDKYIQNQNYNNKKSEDTTIM